MVWVIMDSESKIPTFEIIRDENICKYYRSIGWRYKLYKCDEVIIPKSNEPFSFSGKLYGVLDSDKFNDYEGIFHASIIIKENNLSEKQKKYIELIEKNEFRDDIAEILKENVKSIIFGNYNVYTIKFKSFLPYEKNEDLTTITTSTYYIEETPIRKAG